MAEKFLDNIDKFKEKYTLPEKNIIALDENSEIRLKNKAYRQGLREGGIELPVENQGGGPTDPDKKEFTIAYPKGDIFASWVIAMHELGHLRQAERHGKEKFEEIPETINTETDAWETGWNRVNNFNPEIIDFLEEKFQKEKKTGKLTQFPNFTDFFQHIKKMSIACNQAHSRLPENIDVYSEEAGRLLAKEIKANPDLWNFYTKQEYWKVGKIIDQENVENFIKNMAKKIADEEYES